MTNEDKNLCKDCPLKNSCYEDGCPSTNFDLFNNFFTMSKVQCLWKKTIFFCACDIMDILVKNNNNTFKEYLNQYCDYPKITK